MRIGLDLDGTIVLYDEVFHRHAVQDFGLPRAVEVDKTAVRDWMRANAPGEKGWIELQRIVYGVQIDEAGLAPGVGEFLRECHEAGIGVSVISHKTRHSVAEPQVDLHTAALRRLAAADLPLDPGRIFFEPTRDTKIERIVAEKCVLFVDDLEEVFAERGFPSSVERWLYSPRSELTGVEGVRVFSDWAKVAERARALQEACAAF